MLISIAIVVQIISAIAVIILVLLQHGKGADLGAAFGSGASGSIFGASGSANFLSRSTAVAATFFFLATIALTLGSGAFKSAPAPTSGVLGSVEQSQSIDADQTNTTQPAAPASQSQQIPR
ncbi:MAG TPA: preprotein translocase subunit SecG [Candidatus Aphodousia faecavium]|uniref:Protein-export membrane protein SecG n=1 Tax=Parasutterella secunda TaxID=626947 RepID=A0ABS2GWR5_9BURK|nr:preprotein translocase subunit SecG [Parasutterella secunda]HIT97198.1 preprotein translocase subunit SecG [Candidatus Aphodousia faecavium]